MGILKDDSIYLFVMIAWALTILLRFMDIFLLFSKTMSLYVILIESFKDSQAFLIIVAYICFFFALISSLLVIGDEDKLNLAEQTFMVF